MSKRPTDTTVMPPKKLEISAKASDADLPCPGAPYPVGEGKVKFFQGAEEVDAIPSSSIGKGWNHGVMSLDFGPSNENAYIPAFDKTRTPKYVCEGNIITDEEGNVIMWEKTPSTQKEKEL